MSYRDTIVDMVDEAVQEKIQDLVGRDVVVDALKDDLDFYRTEYNRLQEESYQLMRRIADLQTEIDTLRGSHWEVSSGATPEEIKAENIREANEMIWWLAESRVLGDRLCSMIDMDKWEVVGEPLPPIDIKEKTGGWWRE